MCREKRKSEILTVKSLLLLLKDYPVSKLISMNIYKSVGHMGKNPF